MMRNRNVPKNRSAARPPAVALKDLRGRSRLGAGAHGVGDPFEISDTVPPVGDGAPDGIRSSIDGQGNVRVRLAAWHSRGYPVSTHALRVLIPRGGEQSET